MKKVRGNVAGVQRAKKELADRDKEIKEQGVKVNKEIYAHTQRLINQLMESQSKLLEQVDKVVRDKVGLLARQSGEAERVERQLRESLELNELILRECSEHEILMVKEEMLGRMNQHVDLAVFHPQEEADIKLTKIDVDVKNAIGRLEYKTGALRPYHPAALVPHVPTLVPVNKQPLPPLIPPLPLPIASLKPRHKPVNTIAGLNQPCGVVVCDNGEILVAEYGSNRITAVDNGGTRIRSFGSREGEFTKPSGLAMTRDAHILVTDLHRLQKLTLQGACVKSVGTDAVGMFNYPKGITVHSNSGDIFVADSSNNRIQVFDNQLTLKRTINRPLHSDNNTYFRKPQAVAFDNEGYLYVAEWDNHCITKLTITGDYIDRFGKDQLKQPSSLAISLTDNLIYVTERGNNRVSVFDTRGTFVQAFGHSRQGSGQFKELYDITVDKDNNVFISDFGNNRLVIF